MLKLAAGIFLVLLAIFTARASRRGDPRPLMGGPHPFVRGVLAVTLNPGVWLFLATAGSGLTAAASADGGGPGPGDSPRDRHRVVLTDMGAVVVGSAGQRLPETWRRRVPPVLAAIEAAIGAIFIAGAFLN